MSELTLSVTLERSTCSECGVTYGLPETYLNCRRLDHRTFYCPNGHSQHYPQETEAERLRKSLHAETLARESAERRARQATEERERLQREAERMKKRAKAGVCPCCNRSFQQLARHMATKHPTFPAQAKHG